MSDTNFGMADRAGRQQWQNIHGIHKFILYNKQEKESRLLGRKPPTAIWRPETEDKRNARDFRPICLFRYSLERAGNIAIPVFSLKSEKSFGVGDFGDLKRMVDWAVNTRQKVIQILPINDTTMTMHGRTLILITAFLFCFPPRCMRISGKWNSER